MDLTCFKAYDVRGELGANIDAEICYRIGRSFAQILDAKSIVVGRDARETSPELADAVSLGIMDAGADVLDIGLSGTEEMYWSTTEFAACGGIEVTASHNPINYNGLKMVKAGSKPLDPASELPTVRKLAEENVFETPFAKGSLKDITSEAKSAYVTKLLSFVDATVLKPLKVVVNSGNGAAGPTFDAIATALGQNAPQIEFIRVQHQPDHTFPNGIPNPLLPENHAATADVGKARDDLVLELAAQQIAALAADRDNLEFGTVLRAFTQTAAGFAHDGAVEAAAKAAVRSAHHKQLAITTGAGQHLRRTFGVADALGDGGHHAVHTLGIGSRLFGSLLLPAQLGRRDHFHRARDLLRLLDA